MASAQRQVTMENLPEEVLSDIFIRLLAKELAQMRCVSKSWNALLSDSSFVKSHLHHSIQNNDKILLFFRGGFSFECTSFSARPSRSPVIELTNFIKIPVNPQFKNGHGNVIGSVNGLVCFTYKSDHDDDYALHILNPSLSAMLILPPWPCPDLMARHFRFGFDPKTDDYKVLKLTNISPKPSMVSQVAVYSMRKGSWKSISQSFPLRIAMLTCQDKVCLDGQDGHLHWLGYADSELKAQTIVAFDLFAETFREIPLPDCILHPHEDHLNVLGVLARKLCLMSKICEGPCEVWVMNEYGVADSWVKHHAFSQLSGDIYPCGFTSYNEYLFRVGNDHLALYDPVADERKIFKITSGLGFIKIVEYVESLVWVAPART